MAWAACGKNSPPRSGHGCRDTTLIVAGLDPAVAAAAFPAGDPDLFPRQRAQPAQQRGLVELRREQVVAAALVQVVGVVAVGVDGVGGDQDIGQVQIVEQRGERGDLAALLRDRDLPEDDAAGLVEHRHQMRLPITTAARAGVGATAGVGTGVGVGAGGDVGAAHGLAVQRENLALLAHRDAVGRGSVGKLGQRPRAHRGLDRVRVEVLQDPADGAGVRHHRADPEQVEDGAAGVVGVLGDRGERPRAGQHRARPEQHDRQHAVADPAGMTRVGYLSERLHQGQRHPRDRLAVEAGLRLIEGGNDRGHLQCGHGLPDVVKDLDTLMITSGPCPSLHPLTSVAAGQLPLIATLPQPCGKTRARGF